MSMAQDNPDFGQFRKQREAAFVAIERSWSGRQLNERGFNAETYYDQLAARAFALYESGMSYADIATVVFVHGNEHGNKTINMAKRAVTHGKRLRKAQPNGG